MRNLVEIKINKNERIEIYRDENIVVIIPLTHLALQKYAHRCQWCINSDRIEWEDYHKGRHAMIIQRKPKKLKIGITGRPTASEIFVISRWGEGGYKFKDVCDILEYDFKDDIELSDYEVEITNNINNFATNIVYYSPENGLYDMEDNYLWNYGYEITDIPNITPKLKELIDNYLFENGEEMMVRVNENQMNLITFTESFIKTYEKILNKILLKKYSWFQNIEIDTLTFNSTIGGGYLGISGTISVDADWLGGQWREYFYSIPFPNNLDDVSLGDFIGGELSKSLVKDFINYFNGIVSSEGVWAKTISFSWIKVKTINDEY